MALTYFVEVGNDTETKCRQLSPSVAEGDWDSYDEFMDKITLVLNHEKETKPDYDTQNWWIEYDDGSRVAI